MTLTGNRSFTLNDDRASAKKLRDYIGLHKNDLDWLSEQHTIIYAVDNDVAMLFSKTKQVALVNKYTKIFSGDESINAISLGKVLSHFIFYKLSGQHDYIVPKVLIPPLDREFSRIFQIVFNNSTKECMAAKNQAEAIDVMLNNESLSDLDLAKKLVDQASEVLEVLYGENSSNAEIYKLCSLIDQHKLTSLNEITSNNTEGLPKDFVDAYLKKKSISEMIWTSILKEEWIKKLNSVNKKKEKIADDAEALATLQLINTRLSGTGIRFILITGSPNILGIAEEIKVTEGDKYYTFADLWLRHPRCFLGDSCIINTCLSDNKNNELMEILNGFLADKTEKELIQDSDITEQQISTRYSSEILEFQKAWNKFTANICLDYSTTLEKNNWYDQVAIDLVQKLRSVEGGLKQLLKESWKSVFLAAIQTGFLYNWSLEKSRSRNLPKLIFEDFHEASQFVQEILAYPLGSTIDDFQNKIKKVRCDDSKGYTTYLIFGMLFAAQNNWQIADALADYSLATIYPNSPEPLDSVRADSDRVLTGREGFYLKAVAGRHLAKSALELTVAHKAICHAIEILKLEREIRADILFKDTRFQYELCCINVAALMFERFLNQTPDFYLRLSPKDIKASLLDILKISHEEIQKQPIDKDSFRCCRILTPFFIIELTLIHKIGDAFPSNLLQYLQMFREAFQDEYLANPTTLTKIVFSIVDWWGETDIDSKKVKQQIVLDEIRISRLSFKENAPMPYELKRYDYFEEFIGFECLPT